MSNVNLPNVTLPPCLTADGKPMSTAPERLGALRPTSDVYRSHEDAWARFKTDGYLFLKGVLNRQHVLDFREFYFDRLDKIGVTGIVRTPEYQELCASPEIVRFYEWFLGGAVHLHKRKLVRHTEPVSPMLTGAHYDLVYIGEGTEKVYTSWIPLGDCPFDCGTLMYLENSECLALDPAMHAHFGFTGKGWITKDLAELAEFCNRRWLVSDFEAGDMMVHSPYTIHAAADSNNPKGFRRLSTDIRYQLKSEKIDPRWQNDWSPDDGL